MAFERTRIKENAKKHYEINKWNNVVVSLILAVAAGGSGSISSSSGRVQNDDPSGIAAAVGLVLAFVGVILAIAGVIVALLVMNPIKLGAMGWFQKSIHVEKLEVREVIRPFKENYKDNVVVMFTRDIIVALWTLLLIVPGIIKSIAYSMVEYVRWENQSLSAKEAMNLSEKITDGHKMDLFMLDLSFLGWHLLGAITFGIVEVIYAAPYHNAAKAFAYEELKAEAINSGKVSIEAFGGTNDYPAEM